MAKILVVEDDKVLNKGLSYALNREGYEVISSFCGDKLITTTFDLVILDVNLPNKSGFHLTELIEVPIIFLTAKNQEVDILKGFSLGCEDYVTKPFSMAIFIEKVKVVLRRTNTNKKTYSYKDLFYDIDSKHLVIDNIHIIMTKKEYQILEYLIENKGRVITKRQLLEYNWDIDGDFVNESTVNVTINRMRKKMEKDTANPKWIQTVFGIGYKWSE